MRSESIVRSGSESDESGCESDSSLKNSLKRVHFCGGCKGEEAKCDNDNTCSDNQRCTKGKCKPSGRQSSLKIDRGDMPDGSDIFRQVLKEIQTQDNSDDEVFTPRSDCDSPSKPLKSILKKRK